MPTEFVPPIARIYNAIALPRHAERFTNNTIFDIFSSLDMERADYLAVDVAHSSSGPGHRPLKAEIRGSNPLCATNLEDANPERTAKTFQGFCC